MSDRKIDAPSLRVYPAEDRERRQSVERVVDDIRAAAHLGIPFTVHTIHRRAYRGGGNVNKADIYEYVVEFGKLASRASDE